MTKEQKTIKLAAYSGDWTIKDWKESEDWYSIIVEDKNGKICEFKNNGYAKELGLVIMDQEQKTIKLAEWDGWVDVKAEVDWLPELTGIFTFPHPTNPEKTKYYISRKPVPKYFEDLNAVRRLEKKLTDVQWTDYINNLYYLTFKPAAKDRDKQAIHSSAEDKCEALGKALNLWS